MKSSFNENAPTPFNIGDLIVNKTTGAWHIYAGAISGTSTGLSFTSHMAMSLTSRHLTGKTLLAKSGKAMKDYALVDAETAHDVMQSVYGAIAKYKTRLRVKAVPFVKLCVAANGELRNTATPGAVARAVMDMMGLLHGTDYSAGQSYLTELDKNAYIFAHWANRIYGASVDDTYKAIHTLSDRDAEPLAFNFTLKDVVLKKRKAIVPATLSATIAPSSVKDWVNLREATETSKPHNKSVFTVEKTDNFEWFTVETDTTKLKGPHRILGHENGSISPNAYVLLSILTSKDEFVSMSDIFEADTNKVFAGDEKKIISSVSNIRRALTLTNPSIKRSPLVYDKTRGVRLFKPGHDLREMVPARQTYAQKLSNDNFNVDKTDDYGHFKLETDHNRKNLTTRFAGKAVYIRPTALKLLDLLQNAGGKLTEDEVEGNNVTKFSSLSNARLALKDLQEVLRVAGIDPEIVSHDKSRKVFVLKDTKPKVS